MAAGGKKGGRHDSRGPSDHSRHGGGSVIFFSNILI